MGKDLLTQLARELGLSLPERPQPRPAPRPGSPTPAAPRPKPASDVAVATATAAYRPVPSQPAKPAVPVRNPRVASPDDDHARTVADSLPSADLTSAPGIAAVESANAAAYQAREGRRPPAFSAIRAELFEPDSLRRAFILQTILDKPLSLRTRP